MTVVHDVEGPVHEDADFFGFACGAGGCGGEDVFAFGCEEFFFEGVYL